MMLEEQIQVDLIMKVFEKQPKLRETKDIIQIQQELRVLRNSGLLGGDEMYYINGLILNDDKVRRTLQRIN